MITVAIDCGIRLCGVSAFNGRDLVFARYVRNPTRQGQDALAVASMARTVVEAFALRGILRPDQLAIETMQVYQGSLQKGDPNDLIPLAHVAGFLHAQLGVNATTVRYFKPREWKGQVPANECCRRIVDRLTPDERKRVDNLPRFLEALASANARRVEVGGLDHNTIDAVGVGLKTLGRFEPVRVFAP